MEGDPKHYWVGWMNRNTIIQAGEKYSISTSPNFRSPNGTAHYLTIHSVKKAGKYECKVYTITGDVQDQVSHQVFVPDTGKGQIKHLVSYIAICLSFTDDQAGLSSSTSTLWEILKSFFF